MTKVKYIRISSLNQNTARQEVNSKNFSKVYIDKCSEAIKLSERKEGKKLINHIEDGDYRSTCCVYLPFRQKSIGFNYLNLYKKYANA